MPYSYETNDNRFDQNNGFSTADAFARYLVDCFDLMYEEGAETPKIMSVALHDRLIGRPARAVGLQQFGHSLGPARPLAELVHVQRQSDGLADRPARIERRERVLPMS